MLLPWLPVPPHITTPDDRTDLVVIQNRTIYINCPAEGIPSPSIFWLQDNFPLLDLDPNGDIRELSNGRQLEIRNAQIDAEARYTCKATKVAG